MTVLNSGLLPLGESRVSPPNTDLSGIEPVLMKSIDLTSHSNAQLNIDPVNSEQFTSTHTSIQSDLCEQDSFWTRFWDGLYNVLAPRLEPKIVQKTESDGTEYYQVYDPVTGHLQTFGSELETRIWLERRF